MLYDMFKAGKLGKADDLYTLQAVKHLSGNKTPRERELTGIPPSPAAALCGLSSHRLAYQRRRRRSRQPRPQLP